MSSEPNYVKRYLIGRAVSTIYFWGAVSIPYFTYRGFSISEAFTLLSLYSILVVILEFPTGVIGDLFGHKFSMILANIIGAITMFLVAQNLPSSTYYLLTILAALSASLISGSDDALLKKLSTNFKHDLATAKSLDMLAAFASVSVAGFIAKYSLPLPLYLTGFAWLISIFILAPLPDKKLNGNGTNPFALAFNSLGVVFANLTLLGTIIYAAVNGGFALSVKTLTNSFAPALSLDLGYVGLMVGIGMLGRALFYRYSYYFDRYKNRQLFFIAAFMLVILALIPPGYFTLILMGLLKGFTAVIGLRADLVINDLISDHVRASVLSFKNLLIRLFSTGYLFTAGIAIGSNNFRLLMLTTLILYTVAGYTFIKLNRRQYAKTN